MKKSTTLFGLGDLAYWMFRPFVYVIDWIWSTDMKQCERCHERRLLWNSWLSVPRWVAFVLLLTLIGIIICLKVT